LILTIILIRMIERVFLETILTLANQLPVKCLDCTRRTDRTGTLGALEETRRATLLATV
jgi:hypothetical protein